MLLVHDSGIAESGKGEGSKCCSNPRLYLRGFRRSPCPLIHTIWLLQ